MNFFAFKWVLCSVGMSHVSETWEEESATTASQVLPWEEVFTVECLAVSRAIATAQNDLLEAFWINHGPCPVEMDHWNEKEMKESCRYINL